MSSHRIELDDDLTSIISELLDTAHCKGTGTNHVFTDFEISFIGTMERAANRQWTLTVLQTKILYQLYQKYCDKKFEIPQEHQELIDQLP